MHTATDQRNGIPATPSKRRGAFSSLVAALAVLLVLQLALALGLRISDPDEQSPDSRGPLLDLDPQTITGIQVQDAQGKQVLIKKTDGGWVIPSLGDLPAAEQKVTTLLTKLQGLSKGLPVATSEEASERFKVAEQAFERKLTLQRGGAESSVLYLGDSPGFKRLFVRTGGDGAVYDVELGLFDVPDKADDWSDHTLLHLDAEKIQELKLGDLTLQRKDGAWHLTGLAEGEEANEQAIADKVRALTNIDFTGVFAKGEGPKTAEDAAPIEIEATLSSGKQVNYRITKLAEGNDYLLAASDRPQGFILPEYVVDDLTAGKRKDLINPLADSAHKEPSDAGAVAEDAKAADPAEAEKQAPPSTPGTDAPPAPKKTD